MKVRWCEYAVLTIASIASIMRCNAESVPMVISVPQKSLSIEPTIPAICNTPYFFLWSALIFPVERSSSKRLAHSCLNKLAPVREPSPPMTTWKFLKCSVRNIHWNIILQLCYSTLTTLTFNRKVQQNIKLYRIFSSKNIWDILLKKNRAHCHPWKHWTIIIKWGIMENLAEKFSTEN